MNEEEEKGKNGVSLLKTIKIFSILQETTDLNDLKLLFNKCIDTIDHLNHQSPLIKIQQRQKHDPIPFSSINKVKKYHLTDISYRIIIYEIFPFHLFDVKENVFDLYGYFTRDKTRKIWFLYVCLNINDKSTCLITSPSTEIDRLIDNKMNKEEFIKRNKKNLKDYLRMNKVISISFESVGFEIARLNICNLKRLMIKNVMKLFLETWVDKIFGKEISEHNNNNIEHVVFYDSTFLLSKWSEKMLNNIKSISLINVTTSYSIDKDVMLSLNQFKRLEKFVIVRSNVVFFQQDILWTKYDNFTKLYFVDIKIEDIFFQKCEFSLLKFLNIEKCSKLTGKNWNEMNNLEILRLISVFNFSDDIFVKPNSLNKLKVLELEKCLKITGKKWSYLNKLKRLMILECGTCNSFFQSQPFEHLEFLMLRNSNINGENWKYFNQNLKILRIHSLSIENYIFQKPLDYPKLEELELRSCCSINVENKWSVNFDNLKKVILYLSNFDDKFFGNYTYFNHIEHLVIKESHNFKGIKWNDFKCLRVLEINNCVNMRDNLFNQCKFDSLECLILNLVELKGEKWNIMKKLCHLELNFCPNITDDLLMNNFNFLRFLKLDNVDKIKGDNWKCLPVLKSLIIHECLSIQDSMFQNYSFFNLSYLKLSNNYQLKGINWKEPIMLKELSISYQSFSLSFFKRCEFKYLELLELESIKKIENEKDFDVYDKEKEIFKKCELIKDVLTDEKPRLINYKINKCEYTEQLLKCFQK